MSMNSEKTLYKKNTEPVLTKELFQNPTSEYRGTPFWAWNCKITKELIDSNLALIKQSDIIIMQLEIPLEIVGYVKK